MVTYRHHLCTARVDGRLQSHVLALKLLHFLLELGLELVVLVLREVRHRDATMGHCRTYADLLESQDTATNGCRQRLDVSARATNQASHLGLLHVSTQRVEARTENHTMTTHLDCLEELRRDWSE
jgi:hypothetical protein